MCGIVAALPVYEDLVPLDNVDRLLEPLSVAQASALRVSDNASHAAAEFLAELNAQLLRAADTFSAAAAIHRLVVDGDFRSQVGERLGAIESHLHTVDSWLDAKGAVWEADEVERVQTHLRRALDLSWTLREDRFRAAERVGHLLGLPRGRGAGSAGLAGADVPLSAVVSYLALDTVLDALDRLEVRGRDSAGVHLAVRLDDADLAALPEAVRQRGDALFRSGTIVPLGNVISVVYKTASIVGQLGDNVRAIRDEIAADTLLRAALRLPSARVSVLAHTRWASVGKVSTPNAHPLNSICGARTRPGRYAVAVLNGDIDNHMELRRSTGLPPDVDITTDAKLIPVMVADRLTSPDADAVRAFADCLRSYQGSMAIGLQTDDDPDRLLLGVKGGGQGLYVGFGPAGYVVASEAFGLVSQADRYLRIAQDDDSDTHGAGTVVSVDRRGGGTLAGVRRLNSAGRTEEIPESELHVAEVTTRDVARGAYDRYLEKELSEAPSSFRKTIRGRVHERDGMLSVDLPDSALPVRMRKMLREGMVKELVFIGQGTAAVAAAGTAYIVDSLVHGRVLVRSLPATELSAWQLHQDLRHTCVVAISQSGTTTDTNRAVDLVRERGALVLAIVNRRDSDLVSKSDGVLYTSDGRDIEMAVASTKAFYAQAAAGMLLGLGVAKELGVLDPRAENSYLRMLTEIPAKLEEVQEQKAQIAEIAEQVVCRYPYWAVVGSGPNRIAAGEVRIKLSELCYRGVSADAVEDKKHIDLSAESLILVCAAGTPVTQLHDLIKEVEIFTAHHNRPIVIADAGNRQLWPTDLVIEVPATHPLLAWVLSTAAGHLFAYYAARTIDSAADDLRLALAALDSEMEGGLAEASRALGRFVDDSARGRYRGVLGSDSVLLLARAWWLLEGMAPGALAAQSPDVPATDPVEVVHTALTAAVDELTRSIDSVKHQAKTVTVGTSRSGVDLFENPLARGVLDLGVDRNALAYSTLLALRGYSGVVARVLGATRYAVTGNSASPRVQVVAKFGVAAELTSRADAETALSGTKKLSVDTRTVRLERGLTDERLVLIIPEISGSRVSGITLLHIELTPAGSGTALLAALECSGTRLAELRAAITERDLLFDADRLATLPTETVLLTPVEKVAAAFAGR